MTHRISEDELRQRLAEHSAWITSVGARGVRMDLPDEADLTGARLAKADLSGVRAHGARFTGADLTRAWFSHADLSGADLDQAWPRSTGLHGTDLRAATFRLARFERAVLDSCTLGSTDAEGASCSNGARVAGAARVSDQPPRSRDHGLIEFDARWRTARLSPDDRYC